MAITTISEQPQEEHTENIRHVTGVSNPQAPARLTRGELALIQLLNWTGRTDEANARIEKVLLRNSDTEEREIHDMCEEHNTILETNGWCPSGHHTVYIDDIKRGVYTFEGYDEEWEGY